MKSLLLSLTFLVSICCHLPAQESIRMTAGFSIKQKQGEKGQLVTGQLYYDKKIQKIFYQISYPEPSFWLVVDSFFYEMDKDTVLIKQSKAAYLPVFSIYQQILDNNLKDFGLKKLDFYIANIDKMNDSTVVTEWRPNKKWEKKLGKIVLSHTSRKLTGAVFFDPSGNIISKEFYKKAQLMLDMWVPTEIINLRNIDGIDFYSVTTLRNIIFNETSNEKYYNFPLPVAAGTKN